MTNLFTINFFGELIHAGVNYPGSWHDTKLEIDSGLYDKLVHRTPAGMAILADSAFVNKAKRTQGRLIRGRTAGEVHDLPVAAEAVALDMIMQRAMPSELQSAEWGVRGTKSPFGRLKSALPADASLRRTMLTITTHLYNLRVRTIGRNQIRSVYYVKQK